MSYALKLQVVYYAAIDTEANTHYVPGILLSAKKCSSEVDYVPPSRREQSMTETEKRLITGLHTRRRRGARGALWEQIRAEDMWEASPEENF